MSLGHSGVVSPVLRVALILSLLYTLIQTNKITYHSTTKGFPCAKIIFVCQNYFHYDQFEENSEYRIVPNRRALPNIRPPPFLDVKQSINMYLSDTKM